KITSWTKVPCRHNRAKLMPSARAVAPRGRARPRLVGNVRGGDDPGEVSKLPLLSVLISVIMELAPWRRSGSVPPQPWWFGSPGRGKKMKFFGKNASFPHQG